MAQRNTTERRSFRVVAFSLSWFTSFAFVAGCSSSGEQRKRNPASETPMNNTTTGQVQCAGRFFLEAPEAMNVTGRSQSMYGTNVTTIPVPSGGIDAYWAGRLAQMGAAQREFELQAGVKGAWSARNPVFPKLLTMEIVQPVSGGL